MDLVVGAVITNKYKQSRENNLLRFLKSIPGDCKCYFIILEKEVPDILKLWGRWYRENIKIEIWDCNKEISNELKTALAYRKIIEFANNSNNNLLIIEPYHTLPDKIILNKIINSNIPIAAFPVNTYNIKDINIISTEESKELGKLVEVGKVSFEATFINKKFLFPDKIQARKEISSIDSSANYIDYIIGEHRVLPKILNDISLNPIPVSRLFSYHDKRAISDYINDTGGFSKKRVFININNITASNKVISLLKNNSDFEYYELSKLREIFNLDEILLILMFSNYIISDVDEFKYIADMMNTLYVPPDEYYKIFRTNTIKEELKKNIFIRRGLNGLGDILMMTPVLRELKEQNPNSKITVCVQERYIPLLENLPYVDSVVCKDFNNVRRADTSYFNIEYYVEQQEAKYIKHFGFSKENRIDLTAEPFKILLKNKYLDYFVTEKEKAGAIEFLKECKRPVIGIQKRSVSASRTYPYFSELCKLLKDEGFSIVSFEEYDDNSPEQDGILRVVGKDLRTVGAILSETDLVIATDSGFLHWAAALQKPIITFFNEIDPDLRVRYYKNCHVFYPITTCNKIPCNYNHGPCDQTCFKSIPLCDILNRVKTILRGGNKNE